MNDILKRLTTQPLMFSNIIVASFFVNILGLASSLYVIQVFNRYLGYGTDATLYTLTFGMIIAIIAELLFRFIRYRFVAATNIAPEFLRSHNLVAFFSKVKIDHISGPQQQIPRECQRASEQLQNTLTPTNISTIIDTPFALIFILAVYLLSFTLGIVLTLVLIVGILLNLYGRHTQKKQVQNIQKSQNELQLINSSATQMDTVHAFNAGNFIQSTWQKRFSSFTTLKQKNHNAHSNIQTVTQTLGGILTMSIIFFGAQQVLQGELSIGALIGCNIIASRAFATLSRMIALNQAFAQADIMLQRIQSFLRFPTEKTEGTSISQHSGQISFAELSYQPPLSPLPLFENFSLDIPPNATVAVIGGNSTGKTTLLRLILGLISPSSGQILIKNTDLRQITAESWRSCISYLPQEPQFLHASIRDNVAINAPFLKDKDILKLIDLCDLGTFVRQTADGLAHTMTPDSLEFSLGIKRRFALARALANDGQLILIDEPFTSLDKGGQLMISNIMKNLSESKSKTLIICDHDLDNLPKPDIIVDLNAKPQPIISRP
jgi:ATP-binding cassette subfamily C protein LapB